MRSLPYPAYAGSPGTAPEGDDALRRARDLDALLVLAEQYKSLERFLTDILGLSWAEAHKEAGKWEHVISQSVEVAMDRVLGEPTTCPHGNPIPGTDYKAPDADPLVDIPVGTTFTVRRIPEELEFAPGMLEFLEEADILPGRTGVVTASSPDGTTTVEVGGAHIGIGAFADKGPMRPLLESLPVSVILNAEAGLVGAAVFANGMR